jgi:N-acetylglutamate synthase-like GNAT family acetyltransferase
VGTDGTITLRMASRDDIPGIVALLNAAFAMERDFMDRDRIYPAEVDAYMKTGTYFVEDGADGGLDACMYLEQRGDRMYLGMLAVNPARQGTGLGKQLMALAEAKTRAAGCTNLDIRVVNLRTELPPFYRKLGFVDNGTEPLTDPALKKPAHFLRMTKSLGR